MQRRDSLKSIQKVTGGKISVKPLNPGTNIELFFKLKFENN